MLFENYIQEHLTKVIKHLRRFENGGDAETLHQLRVEMKKVRAAIACLWQTGNTRKIKQLNRYLRDIFRQAGEIRENNLLLEFLEENGLQETAGQMQLEKEIVKKTRRLRKKVPEYEKLLKNYLDDFDGKIEIPDYERLKEYTAGIHHLLEKWITARPNRAHWHGLRKLLKQNNYAEKWLKAEDEKLLSSKTIEYYNQLEKLIGAWHDNTLYIVWLKEARDFYKGTETVKLLNTILKKLTADIKKQETEIVELFKNTPGLSIKSK